MAAMMMLSALLLMQAAPEVPPPPARAPTPPPSRLETCLLLADENPEAGIEAANGWLAEGPAIEPRYCLGVAFIRAGNTRAALPPLLNAAADADAASSPYRGAIWSFAGIAALRSDDVETARVHFTRAVDSGTLSNSALGNTLALRARAAVALNDAANARTDLDRALAVAPENGGTWLISATLARRVRDYARAQADIQQAAALLPREPGVALEAGNIAFMLDNLPAARRSWESVLAISATGQAAETARRNLASLAEEERAAAPTPPPAPQ